MVFSGSAILVFVSHKMYDHVTMLSLRKTMTFTLADLNIMTDLIYGFLIYYQIQ